jgi:hypothetical protein
MLKYVVFSDNHGSPEKLKAIDKAYGDTVDVYACGGDTLDGRDTRASMDLLIKMDVKPIRANHEQAALNVMMIEDEDERLDAVTMWQRVHHDTLASYGIYPNIPTPKNALRLRDKLECLGHLDYLLKSPIYLETDSFVIVHANVSKQDWVTQKAEMDDFIQLDPSKVRISDIPYQLGIEQKEIEEGNLSLAGLDKLLICGHFHKSTENPDERFINNGRQLLIASNISDRFIPVYESWTGEVRNIFLD